MSLRAAIAASLFVAGTALAAPPVLAPGTTFRASCSRHTCRGMIAVDRDGRVHADLTPNGYGPADLRAAYHIDPSLGDGLTIAVVDAYGYAALESDLAVYRAQFGIAPCTIASGCLTVLNDNGNTSPLPADDSEWIHETALDIDMVSAACPRCKIVVVQADDDSVAALKIAQREATHLGMDAISNSWEGGEVGIELSEEADYDIAGVGTFACSDDNGYQMAFPTDPVAAYPGTSQHVITVGGTTMTPVDPSVDPRGFTEIAWSLSGSSCSNVIPKPSWQPASAACSKRAASDISAVADPETGMAIYVAQDHGWLIYGGTSAATPLATATFAAAGHADAKPEFVYKHPEAFLDITQGSNGSCGTNMCIAGVGWDGPTGLGSIDQAKLLAIGGVAGAGPAIELTFPADGAAVAPGFTIAATPADGAAYVKLEIDGVKVAAVNVAPYSFSAPATLADGPHAVVVTAYDLDHNSQSAGVTVTQASAAGSGGGDDAGSGGGGCAAGGSGSASGLGVLGALLRRRRRR